MQHRNTQFLAKKSYKNNLLVAVQSASDAVMRIRERFGNQFFWVASLIYGERDLALV
ncbi:hypothetical protein SCG7086_AQ_00080 [Chlamydiales bacterium SCGC AG-110-P3]|nr:hypothetical protein SCG7086_AQ_00080 [Chlamydiales bacterium SCGC AG-110-P3]